MYSNKYFSFRLYTVLGTLMNCDLLQEHHGPRHLRSTNLEACRLHPSEGLQVMSWCLWSICYMLDIIRGLYSSISSNPICQLSEAGAVTIPILQMR